MSGFADRHESSTIDLEGRQDYDTYTQYGALMLVDSVESGGQEWWSKTPTAGCATIGLAHAMLLGSEHSK